MRKIIITLLILFSIAAVGCGSQSSSTATTKGIASATPSSSTSYSDEELDSLAALSDSERESYFAAKAASKVAELSSSSNAATTVTAAESTNPSELTEDSFKSQCKAYTYEDFSSNPKGMKDKYIVEECEVVGFAKEQDSNVQYLECQYKSSNNGYVSAPFYVKNYSDKGYDFKQYDLITVYGTIEKISQSTTWKAGTTYQAIIDAKYIDYNGKFGE